MWIVTLTSHNRITVTVRLRSHRLLGLADHNNFNWDVLFGMMDDGRLRKVKIDYRPTPRARRIKRIEGLYYLTLDHVIVGKGYPIRQDAWEQTGCVSGRDFVAERMNADA